MLVGSFKKNPQELTDPVMLRPMLQTILCVVTCLWSIVVVLTMILVVRMMITEIYDTDVDLTAMVMTKVRHVVDDDDDGDDDDDSDDDGEDENDD